MPSHLTRHVLRQILANEPIVHRGCLRRHSQTAYTQATRTTSRRPLARHDVALPWRPSQRRTFLDFNIFAPRKRNLKHALTDPGIEEMMQFAKVQRMQARLPPPEKVYRAFSEFFKYKREVQEGVEDNQAQLALQAFRYCQTAVQESAEGDGSDVPAASPPWLTLRAIRHAFTALIRPAPVPTMAHFELVEALHEHLALHMKMDPMPFFAARAYVSHLSRLGERKKAWDVVLNLESRLASRADRTMGAMSAAEISEVDVENADEADATSDTVPAITAAQRSTLWHHVLSAYAVGASEAELNEVLASAVRYGFPESSFASAMLTFYLRHNDLAGIRKWYSEVLRAQQLDSEKSRWSLKAVQVQDLRRVLDWCLAQDHLDYGYEVVREVMANNPPKRIWDVVFVWAAGCGKGADEINRMMDVMLATNAKLPAGEERRVPDSATINGLVEYAISKNDPYLAERFIGIGRERKLPPNSRTFVLQMEYRLKVKDVDGALVAYKGLQSMDLSSNEDVPVVNELIVALCDGKRHDFETIMNVAADLSDRQARFSADCVSRLSVLHLSRDEVDDVTDLLNTHANSFSTSERAGLRQSLIDFITNPNNDVAQAWDAYTLIKTIFDETDREQRTQIMLAFFNHKRPDIAVHIFNAMRAHSRADTIPTIDTYVAFFLAAARARDRQSVELIHNQLKLDYHIDVTTHLLNALIIAYTACGQAPVAVTFWNDISASREGPTYNSLHATLRACEKAPFGDIRAKEIWERLRRMQVELDQPLWASYIAALAGNGDTKLAIGTLEEAITAGEVQVDAFLLGSLFSGALGSNRKAEIERWSKERFPEVWEEVERLEIAKNEDGERYIKGLDRWVEP